MARLPSLTPREIVTALERSGLQVKREGRRHNIMWKEGLSRTVTIERHAREIKRGALADIIKQAGLTQEEFLKYHKGRKS